MNIEAMQKDKFQKYKSDWTYPLYIRRAYVPVSPFKGRCATFQAALKVTLVIGQCFGLMPINGVCDASASKLRFTFKSLRCFYAIVTIIFQCILIVLSFIKTFKDTDSSLGSNTSIIFHVMTSIIGLLFFRLAMQWPRLCLQISKTEAADPNMDYNLIRRCNIACIMILILAMFEHSLAILSGFSVAKDCRPDLNIYESFIITCFPWIFIYVPYNPFNGFVAQFLNLQCTFNWNFADVFVICMSLYLTSRLEQVNQRIQAVKGEFVPSSFWRTMREDYNRASNLVRTVDRAIGGIIFISFANNLFFICLQLLHTLAPLKGYEQALYFVYSFLFLMIRSLMVSLTAARVHTASKAPAVFLYDVNSSTYCIEVQRFLEQIHGDTVALSGLQFFNVKRGLVLAKMSNFTFEEDPDPITNPFYYAQNMDAYYESEIQKLQNEIDEDIMRKTLAENKQRSETTENAKKKSKLSLKKTISKPTASTSNTSYVICKETGNEKAHHLIKICIEDLTSAQLCETNKKNVSVQYLVKDNYEEIMTDTENLISKIIKEISAVN